MPTPDTPLPTGEALPPPHPNVPAPRAPLPRAPVVPAPEMAPRLVPAPLRPGQLTVAWRNLFLVGWVAVLLGFAAVAKTSRTLGLSTWWLGASAQPQIILIQMLPFVPGVLLVIGAARNSRFLPFTGIIGAIALAAIATADIGRFDRLALVQFVIAGGGLAVSIASLAGMAQSRSAARARPEPTSERSTVGPMRAP